jgi:N-acetylmuramoyl-L-alanine amidase
MRLFLLLVVALLTVSIGAARPASAVVCGVDTSALSGPAPLHVSFASSVSCVAANYHWDFGDGHTADVAAATHDFSPGAFTVTFSVDGVVVSTFAVESLALQLDQPTTVTYNRSGTISGRLIPARASAGVDLFLGNDFVTQTQTAADGGFAFRRIFTSPGPYVARSGELTSAPLEVPIRPLVRTSLKGSRIVGETLTLRVTLRPAAAGKLRLVVIRGKRRVSERFVSPRRPIPLPTSRVTAYRARVEVVPKGGYRAIVHKFRYGVGAPRLTIGSQGSPVRVLEKELIAHRFALLGADSSFGYDTLEAVYAVQKLAGLPRTGYVDAATWLALARSRPPRPRLRGNYVEVDKTKQVLYIVRNRKVILIVPVSTGATGNTPIGLFHVYSKVPGGAVMYYSNYFIGAFAIHGYVSVPPYPASHGCVRVPMWVAIRLYDLIPIYTRVLIHY